MGVSRERAQNSAASSLKSATKRLRSQELAAPNTPLPLAQEAASLPMFLTHETHPEPVMRWVRTSTVFPSSDLRASDEQVRETATAFIDAASGDLDALPPLAAQFHLPSEWGGEIFGTKDTRALAAYAAMDFPYVPVQVRRTHHFIDANLTLPFPSLSTPAARLKITSARIAESMGLKGLESRALPFLLNQEEAVGTLWRIHDCLRDFLLEGELIRDDNARRFTATIKSDSLFPWLADDRMEVLGTAFRIAHPRQARHGTVPSTPKGMEVVRRGTLPPSISSEG